MNYDCLTRTKTHPAKPGTPQKEVNTMTRTGRINEMMETMKSFGKEKYQKSELLTEMLALQQEIVGLTFNGAHASTADLKIWDVE